MDAARRPICRIAAADLETEPDRKRVFVSSARK
jgi:hypothetical protein